MRYPLLSISNDFLKWAQRLVAQLEKDWHAPKLINSRSISTNDTLLESDGVLFVDTTSGIITLSLPTAVGKSGRVWWVRRTAGANGVDLAPTGGELINGAANTGIIMARIVSDDENWWTI